MSQRRELNYCKICKKQIFAKVWKIHVMGKKHLYYTPSQIKVTGAFDLDRVNDVHKYFGQFGTIGSKEVINENGKAVIIYAFQDKRAHSFIIYKDHRLFNQPLHISWEEIKAPFEYPQNVKIIKPQENYRHKNHKPATSTEKKLPNNKKIDVESTKRTILNNIKEGGNFSEQIEILQSKLQTDQDKIEENKKIIYDDLTSALAPMFALSRICFFGSSITGLEVQGSDLDVYIANVRESSKPEVQTLKVIRVLIFKSRKFCDVLLISGAKTPIIKCIHTETQMCCDLNIKNKLSVCNSELIKYFLSLDDKLRPLMIMIKFWAECYDLKKVNFVSSYALYMMAIFYLQQEFNFPSVKDLQKDSVPEIVDGWNCNFKSIEFSSVLLKNTDLQSLIEGFFKFYTNFDYIHYVISPFYGSPIRKVCFVKPYDLPDCYSRYFDQKNHLNVNSGICVEDPFELARNVTSSVPLSCAGKFTTMCKISWELMIQKGNDLLYDLLTLNTLSDYTIEVEKPEGKDANQFEQDVKYSVEKILSEVIAMKVTQHGEVYTCIGEQNIWDHRINIYKNLLTKLPDNTNSLDREIGVTECIIKYFPQTSTINMTVKITLENNSASISMKPLNKRCKNFFHVCHFIRVTLMQFLRDISPEEGKTPTPAPSPTEVELTESNLPLSVDMTQKDDKISEENNIADDSLSGKQEDLIGQELEEEKHEDDEDVPPDFFDDFSNQDFMDGLDIVDAWDEPQNDEEASDKKIHSPIRFIKSKSPEKRKRHRSRSWSPRKRSRSRDRIRINDRRDPEKTKRDIHRDKIKVAKDREQKIVNDKLRIVETGLVPPGTEMDVDLTSIIKEKRRGDEKLRERDFVRDRERDLVRERDLIRERELKIEKERRYSRRSSSRERVIRKRYSPSPRPRERERSSGHRNKRRTNSIESNLSARESWLRAGRKRTRSRSKDSPRHPKSKKYEETKKKKSFLEEIRDKLNETRSVVQAISTNPSSVMYNYNNAPHAIPAPAPAPVPAPGQSQYYQPVQQYDQSFFIGDQYSTQNVDYNPIQHVQINEVPQMPPIDIQQLLKVPTPPNVLIPSPKIDILSDISIKPIQEKIEDPTEDIGKLFADKKISLSDFLTITAKCEVQSASPEHLQKKIKVISRCQEAIKVMSDERQFSGRLSVKLPTEQRNKHEVKYQSPLRRIPIVRFHFTSPVKITEDSDVFAIALDKILQKVGVLKETINLDITHPDSVTRGNSSFADEETAALTLKASLLGQKKSEPKECEECRKRKIKIFTEVGSQCADNKETVDVGVQVVEEDINPKKELAKNDSIAYLTPAQLLGKDKEKEAEKMTQSAPEKQLENKVEPVAESSPLRKEKPKPPPTRGRGGFRKSRPFINYEYEEEEYEYGFYDTGRRNIFEEVPPRGRGRYGGPLTRYPRQPYMEEENHMFRLHQFREDESNFTDFSQQSYRGGRGGRFGSRF